MKFTNKKIIVTGANRSIGRQMAIDFAKEGADVVISYRNSKEGALETVKMIQSNGGNALALQADFSKNEGVCAFAKEAIAHLGHIDVLINNAGMLCRETLFELSPERMQTVFQVNTIAPLYLSKLCTKNMVEKKNEGCVINISSIGGILTAPKGRGIGYAASKAAMNKWTQNAARNLAEYGVRVNAIAPGVVESGMNEDTATTDPELWQYFLNNIPLKKPGSPSDISNMALFLASDEASWITGKIFEVDGGHVLV
jgi:NAD(P)-dependent dehydrogenase (short-subunit alcohol dehydrogenase family)